MREFPVLLTQGAVQDLEELFEYIAANDSGENARRVLSGIERAVKTLSENPHRGSYPGELLDLGVRKYREVYFKPYRILYRVVEGRVIVLLIADGRRQLQDLLQRRLLRG